MKNTIEKSKSLKNKKVRMAAQSAASKKMYKQSINNRKSIAAKVMIVLVVIVLAVVLVFVSGVFDISEIIVEGNSKVSKEQIISFSRIEQGTNIFSISKKDVEANIRENSYVNDVIIRRCFPNKIKLTIEERKAEYVIQYANSYLYIDNQGYVLEISNDQPNLPIILGVSTDLSNLGENSKLEEDDLRKLSMVKKIMNTAEDNSVANLITKIDISNEEDYVIYMDTEGKLAYLGKGTELNTRFLYIKAILKEQQGKSGQIFTDVDLNSEYVYFRENI